ncbi:MAG: NAD(P)-dependent oxidoreductase [Burkholderiales bacterium]
MSIELVVSQWGDAIDAALRERLPELEIVAIPRGVPQVFPMRPHAFLALPIKTDGVQPPAGWPGGLRWVQLASVGFDNYPRWLLDAPLVTTANGTSSEVIAEFALACILAANKSLPERWIASPEQWRLSAAPPLRGSVLGLVGFGGIGRALADKALALGMRVLALRRSGSSAASVAGVENVGDIGDLFARADHVVLAAPGTPETRHIVNRDVLRQAKPGLHLVNVARGGLVDQAALLAALDDGQVGRASLDVTEPEPLPAGHPFYTHPRVRLSPHTSAISAAQQDALVEKFLGNLERFRAGLPMEDVVDAARIARGY